MNYIKCPTLKEFQYQHSNIKGILKKPNETLYSLPGLPHSPFLSGLYMAENREAGIMIDARHIYSPENIKLNDCNHGWPDYKIEQWP